jgi:hypothetical protein
VLIETNRNTKHNEIKLYSSHAFQFHFAHHFALFWLTLIRDIALARDVALARDIALARDTALARDVALVTHVALARHVA